jgi:hypothetical protein
VGLPSLRNWRADLTWGGKRSHFRFGSIMGAPIVDFPSEHQRTHSIVCAKRHTGAPRLTRQFFARKFTPLVKKGRHSCIQQGNCGGELAIGAKPRRRSSDTRPVEGSSHVGGYEFRANSRGE